VLVAAQFGAQFLAALGRGIGFRACGGFGLREVRQWFLHQVDDRRAGKREATEARSYWLSSQVNGRILQASPQKTGLRRRRDFHPRICFRDRFGAFHPLSAKGGSIHFICCRNKKLSSRRIKESGPRTVRPWLQ
jgi:hypothetical protein